jgi:phage antirepressor YoqD-like protein
MESNKVRDLIIRSQSGQVALSEYTAVLHEMALHNESLEKKIKNDAPKVEFFDIVAKDDGLIDLSRVSKMLCFKNNKGRIIGRNLLFEFLREKGILQSSKNYHNIPKEEYVDRGYFQVKPKTANNGDVVLVPLATWKGVQFVARLLLANNFTQVKAKEINSKISESQKLLFQ